MTHPATATRSEFAGIFGCKPGYVTQLAKEGRLVFEDERKKRIRVAESLERIQATRDPAMQAVADRHAAARGAELEGAGERPASAPEVGSSTDQGDDDPPPQDLDFQSWKARRERAAALREEMRLAEEAGELVRFQEARAAFVAAFTAVRAGYETLVASLAPTLAAESDEGRVRAVLIEEGESFLREASTRIKQLAKGDR